MSMANEDWIVEVLLVIGAAFCFLALCRLVDAIAVWLERLF